MKAGKRPARSTNTARAAVFCLTAAIADCWFSDNTVTGGTGGSGTPGAPGVEYVVGICSSGDAAWVGFSNYFRVDTPWALQFIQDAIASLEAE